MPFAALSTEHELRFELILWDSKEFVEMKDGWAEGESGAGYDTGTMNFSIDTYIGVRVPVSAILSFRLLDSNHYLLFLS